MRTSRALDNPAVFIACSLRPFSSRDVCCMSMDTSVPPTATLVNIGLPRPVDDSEHPFVEHTPKRVVCLMWRDNPVEGQIYPKRKCSIPMAHGILQSCSF